MGFNRRGNGGPAARRYVPAGRTGGNFRERRGSADANKGNLQRNRFGKSNKFRRADRRQGNNKIKGRRLIRKKVEKPVPKDKDDLDRQMREYWVKTGSAKGKEEAIQHKNLAAQKMNEEMDEYWKKATKKKEQK